jgi:hypothetical protein
MEIAMDSFFIVFIYRLDELGPPIAYRRDGRNVVVFDTRPEAEDAALALPATNKLYRYRVPALMTKASLSGLVLRMSV